MKKTAFLFAAALALFLISGPAVSGEGGGTLDNLAAGKASLEKKCKFCHSLSRTLSKNKTREEWSLTVKRMVTYGASLNSAERGQVTDYLAAKSSFETNCNACHSNLRVLSESTLASDWQKTVERMSAHLAELAAKDEEKKKLTPRDVEAIAAYLNLVIPKD